MTTNYTQMGTDRALISNVISGGTLYFQFGTSYIGGMGVKAVDVNAGTVGVIIGDENDLPGNPEPQSPGTRNDLSWFKGGLYWHVRKKVEVGERDWPASQIWKYDGTPGNWTRVFDQDIDFGIVDDVGFSGTNGMWGDTSTDYLYLIDTRGNVFTSQDGSTWGKTTVLTDIRAGAANANVGWPWGSEQGRLYVKTSTESGRLSDLNWWLFSGLTPVLTWAVVSNLEGSIIASDWRNAWRFAFPGAYSWTREYSISGATTWNAPTNDWTPIPTHNLYGYTVGMAESTGDIYLWDNAAEDWESVADGEIDTGVAGDMEPVFFFRLPSNNETYVVYIKGGSSIHMARRTVTLPVISPPGTGISYSAGGMPGKVI